MRGLLRDTARVAGVLALIESVSVVTTAVVGRDAGKALVTILLMSVIVGMIGVEKGCTLVTG